MMNIKTNKIMSKLLAVLLLVVIAVSFCFLQQNSVGASPVIKFDNTDALDDLQSSENFNILEYPFFESNTPKMQIINVVEYCYTFRLNSRDNYGVYLYVYNPNGQKIVTASPLNKAQLAVSYRTENGAIIADDYEKFGLSFCSMSEEPNYYGLFYKFKIIDHVSGDGKTIVERVNSNARRYDISGIELQTEGNNNATDYTVGGTYTFTGYAKGYGADITAESNLSSDVTELETVRLNVRDSVYRTADSAQGKYHQNQLNSVYFAVDNEILEKYGKKLQKVKAEWYEYKTTPMIAMSDMTVYNAFQPYIGVPLTADFDTSVPVTIYGVVTERGDHQGAVRFNWSYNGHTGDYPCFSEERQSVIYNMLLIRQENLDTRCVPKADLVNHFMSYDKTHDKGYLPVKNGQISADLFEDVVDSGRTRGYNCVDIDAGDTLDLLSYSSSHGFWDKVGDYGFWETIFGGAPSDTSMKVQPIIAVTDSDMNGDFGKTLLLNPSYTNDFQTYYNENKALAKTTFLFRYSATDYKAFNVHNNIGQASYDRYNGYYAQETVFFDFDILQLTFNRDGVYTAIPVVSSPIDAVGELTPPPVNKGVSWAVWLALCLILIIAVILLVIFAPNLIVSFIKIMGHVALLLIKGIWWLICAPVRFVKWIIKKVKSKKATSINKPKPKAKPTVKKPKPMSKAKPKPKAKKPHVPKPVPKAKKAKSNLAKKIILQSVGSVAITSIPTAKNTKGQSSPKKKNKEQTNKGLVSVNIKTHKDNNGGHPHVILENYEDRHVSVGLSTKPTKGKGSKNYKLEASPLCDGKQSYMRRQGEVKPTKEYEKPRKGAMTPKDYGQAKIYGDRAKRKYVIEKDKKK